MVNDGEGALMGLESRKKRGRGGEYEAKKGHVIKNE